MSNDLVHAMLWQYMFALCAFMQQPLLLDANDLYAFGGRLPWYLRDGYPAANSCYYAHELKFQACSRFLNYMEIKLTKVSWVISSIDNEWK